MQNVLFMYFIASIPADLKHYFGRKKFNDHIPIAHRLTQRFSTTFEEIKKNIIIIIIICSNENATSTTRTWTAVFTFHRILFIFYLFFVVFFYLDEMWTFFNALSGVDESIFEFQIQTRFDAVKYTNCLVISFFFIELNTL